MEKPFSRMKPVFAALIVVFLLASCYAGYRVLTRTNESSFSGLGALVHISDSSWFTSHFRSYTASSTSSTASVISASTTPSKTASSTPSHASAPVIAVSPEEAQRALLHTKLALALPSLRSASVNIICAPTDRSKKAISGSGVIIDSRGLILTAAHVGQYFLFQSYPKLGTVSCVIRTGSPARDTYTASVAYISKSWIEQNPSTMATATPKGTGEDDFALLAITGSTQNTTLPSSFPSVPLGAEIPSIGEPVVIGSYGAEFTDPSRITSTLFPTLVFGSVKNRYTFGTNSVDLISLGGNAAAQEGSSGGGVINASGELIGLITTSSTNGDYTLRDLHAITPGHLERSFEKDMALSLSEYLASAPPQSLVNSFSNEANILAATLLRN